MRTRLINIMASHSLKTNDFIECSVDCPFDEMILSWNTQLIEGQTLHFKVQFLGNKGWTEKLDWAYWTLKNDRHSFPDQTCLYGSLNVDVFTVRPDSNIEKIRIYVLDTHSFNSNFDNIRGLFASFLNKKSSGENQGIEDIQTTYAPTPVLVQYPLGQIGHRICSPTTCAMLMGALGPNVPINEVAELAYDSGSDLYGNWSFNMAAVSQFGYTAIVKHFESAKEIYSYIQKGQALGISISTPKSVVLQGALQAYPSGHLLVVTGFIEKNGRWFIAVNDPADYHPRGAQRLYDLKTFEKHWSGVGYIIKSNQATHTSRNTEFDRIKNWIPNIHLELKYKSSDNIMGEAIYDLPIETYELLRVGTLIKLAKAQFYLNQHGLWLKVWDGFRPLSSQKKLWALKPDERFVAHPLKGSKHNRGCAVDVTLCTDKGLNLEMPTAFDDFTPKAQSNRRDWGKNVARNMKHLQEAMTWAGFLTIPDEWWHFDDASWESYEVVKGKMIDTES